MITEELVTLTQAIASSDRLREWFATLEKLPKPLGEEAIHAAARHLAAIDDSPGLREALDALARPEIFEAVRSTVSQLDGR